MRKEENVLNYKLPKKSEPNVEDETFNEEFESRPASKVFDEVPRYLQMWGRAVIKDDIDWHRSFAETKRSPNSTRAQKFFSQSHYYRASLSYACFATLKNSAKTISSIAKDTGMSIQQAMKIANEAEEAGYFYQWNKGNPKFNTSIAATEWITIDYLQRYVVKRIFNWYDLTQDFSLRTLEEEFTAKLAYNMEEMDKLNSKLNALRERAIKLVQKQD